MCLQNTETTTHDGDALSDSTDEISDEEEEKEEEEESEFVRASNRLLSARQLFEHTVALGKKKKGQLKTLREEEERKREAKLRRGNATVDECYSRNARRENRRRRRRRS